MPTPLNSSPWRIVHLFVSALRPPLRSTLFPYTTLFRSKIKPIGIYIKQRMPNAMEVPTFAEQGVAIEGGSARSEEHTSELQSLAYLVCRLLLEKKNVRPYMALVVEVQSGAYFGWVGRGE